LQESLFLEFVIILLFFRSQKY